MKKKTTRKKTPAIRQMRQKKRKSRKAQPMCQPKKMPPLRVPRGEPISSSRRLLEMINKNRMINLQ